MRGIEPLQCHESDNAVCPITYNPQRAGSKVDTVSVHTTTTELVKAPETKSSRHEIEVIPSTTSDISARSTEISAEDVPGDADHPWCIYTDDVLYISMAVVIPHDGSKTEGGWDTAGRCGIRFIEKLNCEYLVECSDFHYHYGVDNSCCVTFRIPDLPGFVDKVEKAYSVSMPGIGKLDCVYITDETKAVCPAEYNVPSQESVAERDELDSKINWCNL